VDQSSPTIPTMITGSPARILAAAYEECHAGRVDGGRGGLNAEDCRGRFTAVSREFRRMDPEFSNALWSVGPGWDTAGLVFR